MKNVLRNLTIVLTLLFTFNITTQAAPVKEQLQQRDSLEESQLDRQAIETKIEEFDNEIQQIMVNIDKNKDKISDTKNAIEETTTKIQKIENEVEKEQDLFNGRMRNMYINGLDGYMDILLDSESFGDFISRVENVKTIIEFDRKVMGGFEKAKKQLNEKKQSLNKTNEVLLALQVENEKKLKQITKAKEDQTKLITEIESQEVTNSYALGGKSTIKIEETTPSRGSGSLSSSAVLAYAYKFLGTPYVWGGTSPSPGFDCSGFTQYVYAHFGVSIGRTTFDQINDGFQVSRSQLQPGDLVFFGSYNNPHHVGIYLGDNSYIHAPRTGDVLKISPMTRRDFVTGRRVN